MRKRLTALLLALLLTLCLPGCGEAGKTDDGKLQIVATLFPYYDFARALAGDRADVTLLISPGRESHSYEPTPLDLIRIGEADLFLYNGGTDEAWVADTLSSLKTGRALAMMDYVDTLEEQLTEGMQAEKGEEDSDEIEYDEHIWTSPVNAKLLAEKIAEALIALDPGGADVYRANLRSYLAELSALDDAFRETVAGGRRTLLVFGDRFPFLYFCETYGLSFRAAFLGCSTETEPSAATLAYLIDKVKAEQIPVVYYLELSSRKVANAIAEATGAQEQIFYSCQSISLADFNNGETYLSLMWKNVGALRKGLN